nr:hypothetical protein [uncultured Gammaproteobacteria bacterium]
MNVLETEWWTMAIPPEWWADSEDDCILIGDQDKVGSIQISTLLRDEGEFNPTLVREIAESESEQPLDWQPVKLGDFTGVYSSYVEEETGIREWYVGNGKMMLFITYSCDEENLGMDNAAVDEFLDTLMVLEEESRDES